MCIRDSGMSVGDALLTPTKIYVKAVLELLPKVEVCGISHITGGGFYENIPRSIPDGLGAVKMCIRDRSGGIRAFRDVLSCDGITLLDGRLGMHNRRCAPHEL